MSTRIEIAAEEGTAPAFVFGEASKPRVLFLIDGLGMRPAMHAMAERLAGAGYLVLMPDLFYRLGAYTAPDARELFSNPEVRAAWWARHDAVHTAAKLVADVGHYLAYLDGGKVGVTGYCMGGRLAMTTAATYPDRIAAVAAFHPGGLVTDAPDSPHLSFGKITAEVYIAGAIEDATFTDAQRETVAATLDAAGVKNTVEQYDAKHGWVPTDTPVHDAAAAELHWEMLLALFERTLR